MGNCGKSKNCVPPSKRKCLSLDKSKGKSCAALANKENDIRYKFLSTEELETLRENYKVPNTERKYAVEHAQLRNLKKGTHTHKGGSLPGPLCSTDPAALCEWLSLFAAETRNAKGKPYASSTYQLLSSLLRHMQSEHFHGAVSSTSAATSLCCIFNQSHTAQDMIDLL